MTHMHITAWVAAIVLLLLAMSQLKKGNKSNYKMMHLLLRVDYLLIIGTGIAMLLSVRWSTLSGGLTGEYITKATLGIIIIGIAEMFLGGMSKEKKVKGFGIALIAVFILIVALGLRLPFGFQLF